MKPWQMQVLAAVLTITLGGGALGAYNHFQREIGRRDLLVQQFKDSARIAAHRADSLSKVYRVDTVRLWRLKREVDTATVTVDRWKHDTVAVVRYVERADSALRACTMAVQTCEQRVGAEKAGRLSAEARIRVLEGQLPSKLAPWKYRLEGALVAFGVSFLVPR